MQPDGMHPDLEQLARELKVGIGQVVRRLRAVRLEGDLTMPETAALSRLDRGGPTTSSALARQEQISPQSMGATLAALEANGLVERTQDPEDGRRVTLSVTEEGRNRLTSRREAAADAISKALATHFTPEELATLRQASPLIQRLGETL